MGDLNNPVGVGPTPDPMGAPTPDPMEVPTPENPTYYNGDGNGAWQPSQGGVPPNPWNQQANPVNNQSQYGGQPQPNMGQPLYNMGQPQLYGGQPQPNMGQPQPYGGQPQPYGGQPQHNMGQPQPYGGQPPYNGGQPQPNMDQPPLPKRPAGPGIKPTRKRKKHTALNVCLVIALVVAVGIGGLTFMGFIGGTHIPKDVKVAKAAPTSVNISITDDVIQFEPLMYHTNLSDVSIQYTVDSAEMKLVSADMFPEYTYLTYVTESPVLGLVGYKIYTGNEFFDEWYAPDKQVKKIANSKFRRYFTFRGVDDGADITETVSSLCGDGYLGIARISEKKGESGEGVPLDSKELSDQIEGDMKISKDKTNAVMVNIAGIGDLNLNDIESMKDNVALLYGSSENSVFIYDVAADRSKLIITNMYNQNISNVPERLIPYEDYSNVYQDLGWRDNSDFGYGGFAVMTDEGMYYFKVTELVENPDEFMVEILDWLGVDPSDEAIDTGYNINLTIDDMKPAYKAEVEPTEDMSKQ